MRKMSIFGYDTRSWRSALVMRAVDLLNPCKRTSDLDWRAPVVVSSVAGLGDLFIHLPLISGIVNACRKNTMAVSVALRPAHLEIGAKCGWDVFPFDNGLEDYFKNPRKLRLSPLLRGIAFHHPAETWIDLTGSAISGLAIKAAGAKRIAARITRGGRSLVDHPLPHSVQENEYANRDRVAEYLGVDVDLALADRWLVEPSGEVVVCLTTASRWKNWPLQNFRQLIERFPQTRFTIVGFRREVRAEEFRALDVITRYANVSNQLDKLSALELVDLIAHSRAVVTNDTSAAHIANFFGKPGAVLFGPVSPKTFAAPDGLRVFHDATCPLHPCVQWRCDNQANWCMRKISVDDVAAHLANILALNARSTSSLAEPALPAPNEPDWQRQTQLPV